MSAQPFTGVEAQMLIRKPVAMVFRAFTDPAITTHFWFTHASGMLEKGKTVTWEWRMYGVLSEVHVRELIPDSLIVIEWQEPPLTVEFMFEALTADTTYVTIRSYGFQLEGDALIRAINDNTGGFTTVLDGLKAYLEHGIELNLVADKFARKAGA
ncbi:SRPBCC family protein [Taibaiella koreensis]|uniref:SRPBCC family protein n=1 Tax=Taibaiella koreensis TaxID=1268548 RepID=UPI0013C355AB|nr:SRPBCC family protein [Taibaiella koreensis]